MAISSACTGRAAPLGVVANPSPATAAEIRAASLASSRASAGLRRGAQDELDPIGAQVET